jgi:hypothetical protein
LNSGSGTEFLNAKHIIDQINTMQQIIIMYECMNRKSEEFYEFGLKNNAGWSSGSKDMGFGRL